jgi:hypothetical protein
MLKAKQNFHITDEEVEAQEKQDEIANKLHKHLKRHSFPNASTEELKKGREELTHSLHLAQQHIKPLEGLKEKQTAYDLMSLVTCVGFINSVDAVAIATLFNEYNEGHDVHQQLGFLRRMQVIGKRVDAQTDLAAGLVSTAFGSKGEKIQFQDEFFKSSEPLHHFVDELKRSAAEVHKDTIEVDALMLKLEKDVPATKSK